MRIRSIVLAGVVLLYGNPLFEDAKLWRVTYDERARLIAHAAVWHSSEIRSLDVFKGPEGPIAVPPETEVTCRYVEPKEKPKGYSPKFLCTLIPSGKLVRVKFGSNEAHAEPAGTRLLWLLGFYTDHVYPVRLKCVGCPQKNPAHPSAKEARVDRIFTDAIMEENFAGKEIGEFPDQGWTWKEIDRRDMREGATRAQIDALKLLAVFFQHTDSKAEQQRLACYMPYIDHFSGKPKCKKPVLMIQDLGETFGKGTSEITMVSSMNLNAWKSISVWKQQCVARLTSATFAKEDGLNDPQISEEGRQFLANLLNQLSDKQIRDLFKVARADKLGEMIQDGDRKRAVTIDDWIAAFKAKRKEINDRHCPP